MYVVYSDYFSIIHVFRYISNRHDLSTYLNKESTKVLSLYCVSDTISSVLYLTDFLKICSL